MCEEFYTPIDLLNTIFYIPMFHTLVAPVTYSDKKGQFRKEDDQIVTTKDYTAYSTLSL